MENPSSDYTIRLTYRLADGSEKHDTLKYRKKQFITTGTVENPQRGTLLIDKKVKSGYGMAGKINRAAVFLEKGTIRVLERGGFSEIRVGGTSLNEDYQQLMDVRKSYLVREDSIRDQFSKANARGDTTILQPLYSSYEAVLKEKGLAELYFFQTHLDSFIALDWLRERFNVAQQRSIAYQYFDQMSARIKNSRAGKAYAKQFDTLASAEIGQPAPLFVSKDQFGKEYTLESFRGRYVLLDFWASWCVPCRLENALLVEANKKYGSRGLTIVGYSLDTSKDKWLKAVADDRLNWVQLSDLQAVTPVTEQYGVKSIPSNVIIDPNGVIIARDLRGTSLLEFLKKKINN